VGTSVAVPPKGQGKSISPFSLYYSLPNQKVTVSVRAILNSDCYQLFLIPSLFIYADTHHSIKGILNISAFFGFEINKNKIVALVNDVLP